MSPRNERDAQGERPDGNARLTDELGMSVWEIFGDLPTEAPVTNLLRSEFAQQDRRFEQWGIFIAGLEPSQWDEVRAILSRIIRNNSVETIRQLSDPEFTPHLLSANHRRATPDEIHDSRFFRIGFQGADPREI